MDADELQNKSDDYEIMIAETYASEVIDLPYIYESLEEDAQFMIDENWTEFSSWNNRYCNGTFEPNGDVNYYGSDDRVVVQKDDWPTTNNAIKSSVIIFRDSDPSESENFVAACSGAFVDNNDIVTAAHCVTDGWQKIPAGDFHVCTQGNYGEGAQCFEVSRITISENYIGGWLFKNDFAIIRITGIYPYFMGLSNHTDAQLEAFSSILHVGSPIWRRADNEPDACVENRREVLSMPGNQTIQIRGNWVETLLTMHNSGPLLELTDNVIGAGIDATYGQSGGPLYVIDNNQIRHVGILKGYHVLPNYVGGPRTSSIRTTILSNL